ncbi:MAG: autotransporter domain-containing protein [Candidatus Andeanibacterium colombiense]|uniref:Autotransporter domain-containing protein n=1 Tax=Candidatus Andeanibacterium colombiense TaxID=3121345 RepID=A0AAJ5X8M6_9SPHN|nr:MAG: autotransporter domain-containing protein [Sphingomonadaceae bacterium]
MPRHLFLTTAALAAVAVPALAPAYAANISTAVTAPVLTATANSGNADNVTITSTGSVKPAGGTAVTQNSNNSVTNQGTIQISNANGAIGIGASAGVTGDILNSKDITIDEPYSPTDSDNDGDIDGPFALGSNRFGIRTDGAHGGKITNDINGAITVEGNDSAGIWLGGAQTGNVTNDGKITVTGDRSVGLHAGDITGNVRLAGTVSAKGKDAVGAEFTGDITGALVVQGSISATGYRYTSPPNDPSKLDADDLLQGGPALVVAGNVTGGIVLAVPPKDNSASDTDEDDDGIDDAKEGSAAVVSYGAAPAFVIGSATDNIAIGPVAGTATHYGLQIDGAVVGNGVYAGVDGNGLAIGGLGGTVAIANGIAVAGSVSAVSKDSNATALRLGAGASTPVLQNSGTIQATGSSTGTTRAVAVQVDAGASLPAIKNSGTISATATNAAGNATAIRDLSGTVTSVENSGKISATGAAADSGRNIAIDLSANTTGATIKQTAVGSGFAAPSITGDIRFGTGALNDLLDVADGTVTGNVFFGDGNNAFVLSGDAVYSGRALFGTGNDTLTLNGTSVFNGIADFAGGGNDTLTLNGTAWFKGSFANSGNLAVAVSGGFLDVSKPATMASLNVGAGGTLVVTLDKDAGQGSLYTVTGNASFADKSTLLVRLADTENAVGRYTVLEAGSITGASGIVTRTDLVPFMFKAALATDAGANKIAIDITKRTATELGLNRSQASAYDAIYAVLAKDDEVEQVFLGVTDGTAFRDKIRRMLPDHAGGAFEAISLGSRTLARSVSDPYGPVYHAGNLDVLLNAAAWNSNKGEGATAAYDLGGFGISTGVELQSSVGSFGVTLQWMWNEYTSGDDDNIVQADTYELAGYWRGQWGKLNGWARGSYGKANFSGRRTFTGSYVDDDNVTKNIERSAHRDWNGDLVTFNGGASYESGGTLFFRPTVTFDYVRLNEDGYTDSGGGAGLNLTVDARHSDELALNGGVAVGIDFIGNSKYDRNWFRIEGEGGWRQVVGGELGSTTAHFANGSDFTLTPDQTANGWYARLRAMGGSSGFSMGGDLGAEDRNDHTAFTVRGTLRMGF